ncbi:50S ribosomal protein L22 [Solirubrobacter deserti]|uniref:50S ribosomal protein L22 n=1 Tax=Solirubrobacter deserti TaxID=2282478 RepID=UPI0019309009
MSPEENKNDQVEENVPDDAVEETPQAEGTSDEPVDQQERADEAAARATDAAVEAEEAADEAGTETAVAAAAEAEEAADTAQAAAEAASEKPKREKSRKAREAEQAADQAEAAADEAKQSARRVRGRRGGKTAEEPKAVPVGLKVSAQAKYVRTSARKARLVCDHIRGKDVVEARAILAFATRDAAKPWLKLLESAVANAEHNHELVGEDLKIFAVHADEGPTLKRYRPRAMGRATRIRKRTSHLTITLTPKES